MAAKENKESKITYNGVEYKVTSGQDPKKVLDAMKHQFPELHNATLEADGDNWKCKLNYGKKG